MKSFFSVDVDCDLAWPGDGEAAVTKGKAKAEFSYSGKGLLALVNLLNKLGISGTFFFEARTALELDKEMGLKELMKDHEVGLHGFEHEDFTKLTYNQKRDKIARGKWLLEKIFSTKITGFRAPYLRADQETTKALKEEKIEWDSSCLVENSILPQVIAPRELYFWPVIEGSLGEEEFWQRIKKDKDPVLSTHSWHAAVDLKGKERNPVFEEKILKKMVEAGFKFELIGGCIKNLKNL